MPHPLAFLKAFAKDLFTGIDGESFDAGRFLWIVGAVVFLGLAAYAAVHSGTFDPLGFGTGYGGVLAGGGAGLKLKQSTEPGQDR